MLQRAAELVTPIEDQLLLEEAMLSNFLLDATSQVASPAEKMNLPNLFI